MDLTFDNRLFTCGKINFIRTTPPLLKSSFISSRTLATARPTFSDNPRDSSIRQVYFLLNMHKMRKDKSKKYKYRLQVLAQNQKMEASYMRQLVIIGAILCSLILIIPTMLVLAFQGEEEEQSINSTSVQTSNYISDVTVPAEDITISVFRTGPEIIEEVEFEDYIIGVVASEMLPSFSMEALKAQALAARTYIIKHLLNPTEMNVPNGAMVTDTVMHQVFRNEEDLREFYGKDYEWNMARITEAVQATRGQIITYEGDPITASFFSTSNGYTENSEDYWTNTFPYLRSVESPWDSHSPKYSTEKVISTSAFQQALGVTLPGDGSVGEITDRTEGGRVATVNINGKTFTGREIREKLDLDSSDFQWKRSGHNIVIETKGWGHGVGMSQYGADGLAKEGKNYQEIIQHYYTGVEIASIDPYIANLTANAE